MSQSLRKIAPIAVATLFAAAALADPVPGATREAVLAEMGRPTARSIVGARETLMFPRGKIVLDGGVVHTVSLLTPDAYARAEQSRLIEEDLRRERAAKDAEAYARAEQSRLIEDGLRRERAAIAEEARATRRAVGAEALAKITGDPRWQAYSAEDRLEILTRFAKANPDADLDLEWKLATGKRDREAAERHRIDALETRVAAAERRASEAESCASAAAVAAARAESRSAEIRYIQTPVCTTPVTTNPAAQAVHTGTRFTVTRPGISVTTGSRHDTCPPAPPAAPKKEVVPLIIAPARVNGVYGPQWRVNDKGTLEPSTTR